MALPAWLSDLENIGKHINEGIKDVADIIVKFAPEIDMIPIYGPAIAEIAGVVSALESKSHTVTADDFKKMVQTLTAASHIKAAVATIPKVPLATTTITTTT